MEASTGETFALFSTGPITRRRLRKAHAARNAYIRALLTGWLRAPRALFMQIRLEELGQDNTSV